MAPIILDGKLTAEKSNAATALEVEALAKKYNAKPGLAVILVGDNPASKVYVSSKVGMCARLGIYSEKIVLPAETTQEQLLETVEQLNNRSDIHGILVQSPVPAHIDESAIVDAISPAKDVDCFHPENVGRMLLGDRTGFLPCTPWGVTVLFEEYGIETAGRNIVILGRSNIVGKPMAALLLGKGATGDATVTICHSKTKNIADFTRRADIIVAAIGKAGFLRGDMVSEGVVVADVGINRVEADNAKGYKLVGDVDFEEVSKKASYITPVPGGVGPMTIAMLMRNTVRAFRKSLV